MRHVHTNLQYSHSGAKHGRFQINNAQSKFADSTRFAQVWLDLMILVSMYGENMNLNINMNSLKDTQHPYQKGRGEKKVKGKGREKGLVYSCASPAHS